MSNTPLMDIKKFRELGYLQELNRRFLHPLGLALAVGHDENHQEILVGIWDYRNDPEGIFFDLKNNIDEDCRQKAAFVTKEQEARKSARIERLGFFVEPIPEL